MSGATESSTPRDIVRDVFLWRRKHLSVTVLLVATATWVVMEVYQFNFITVASWMAMLVVTSMFIWGNIHRLLHKEEPNVSGLEISEQTTVEMAKSIREWAEEGIRWMFRVGAEGGWLVFAASVAGLWLLSVVGSYFDLLTLLYIGIVVGMTVPVICVKYDYKIREYWERLKMQSKRFYGKIDEKLLKKIKKKTVGGVKKEKKVE